MSNVNRVKWIDGVKGVACILILLHHYMLAFFPSSYYGAVKESHCNGLDTFLSQSVFSFFMNGNFLVHLYILITGYVVSLQIKNMEKDNLFIFSLKRYIKLAFPILVYCFIFWLKQLLPCFSEIDNITFVNVFKHGLIKVLFFGSNDFGGHFWMLNIILLGGFAVSLVATNSWHFSNRKMFFLFTIITFIIILPRDKSSILYATCFSGGCLYFLIEELKNIDLGNKKIFIFSLILSVGVFFGAYPTGVIPTNYYRFFYMPFFKGYTPYFLHFVGAVLFFFSISQLVFIQGFFDSKLVQIFAKYSYSFYILHGFGLEVASFVFSKIDINYVLKSGICLLIAILFTFVISILFQKFIVSPFNVLLNNFIKRFFKTN